MITQAEKLARESAKNAAVAAIDAVLLPSFGYIADFMLELKARADADANKPQAWGGLYGRPRT